MANEVVIKSGQSLPVGPSRQEICNPDIPVAYVDMVTEAIQSNGIIALSLGSSFVDADNDPKIMMAVRVRMHLGTAQFLHKLLGDMITNALKPPEDKKAN